MTGGECEHEILYLTKSGNAHCPECDRIWKLKPEGETAMTKPEVCKNPTDGWNVEQVDDDGGCLVTIFTGPEAEKRARDYAAWREVAC